MDGRTCVQIQAAVASAQDAAKAKADALVADIKATPTTLQREAVKAGEAAVDEVRLFGIMLSCFCPGPVLLLKPPVSKLGV